LCRAPRLTLYIRKEILMKLRTIALMLAVSVTLWAQTPDTTPAPDTKDAKPGCCAHMGHMESDKMGADSKEANSCAKHGKSCCAGMHDKKDGKEAKMACSKGAKEGMACCKGKEAKDAKAGCCAGMGKDDEKDAAAAMKHDDMHHAAGDKMSCGKDGKSCCGDKKEEKKAGGTGHSCCC
jgi:hypothetical protein